MVNRSKAEDELLRPILEEVTAATGYHFVVPSQPIRTTCREDWPCIPDFLCIELPKLAIFLDGERYHGRTLKQARKTRAQTQSLIHNGYTVLRLPYREAYRTKHGKDRLRQFQEIYSWIKMWANTLYYGHVRQKKNAAGEWVRQHYSIYGTDEQ